MATHSSTLAWKIPWTEEPWSMGLQRVNFTERLHFHLERPSHLPPHPTPSRWIQSPCLSFLSHTANSRWLSMLHMVMQVSMLLFPYISSSPPSPQVCSLCLFLHCCPVNKFFSAIFLMKSFDEHVLIS